VSSKSGVRLSARVVRLFLWCLAAWVLLVWTSSVEALLAGAVVSLGIAVALAPFGEVARPWALLAPRRFVATVLLLADALWRVVRANVGLARRIWTPGLPLATGMVIVPTQARSDRALAAVGVLTSLVVDNQLVDLDRARHELQFHCVAVPPGDAATRRETINGPVERRLADVERRGG
jgi:multicomponent Na+:H+ antiporter subunit E